MKALAPSFLLLSITSSSLNAQTDDDLSLSDMLNVEIVTASKKSESKFEAPLSSVVITKEEIERSGVTNIQEALRLSPSVVSRQLSNGQFEYSIRGALAPSRGGSFQDKQAGTVLVMIDNRVVFNYYAGAVLWNTLPIGLHDVEQIEIVKGPSSALYGPNAVSGVINIITRKAKTEDRKGLVTLNYGAYRTSYGGASYTIGSEDSSVTFSVNGDRRERYYKEWYSYNSSPLKERHTYKSNPAEVIGRYGTGSGQYKSGYKNPERANNQASANIRWNKKLSEGNLMLTSSIQNNRTQTMYADPFITNFINQESNSGSTYLNLDYAGFKVTSDYTKGQGNLIMGTTNNTYFQKYVINDNVVEKEMILGNFEFKPGINYKTATYDSFFIGGKRTLSIMAGMFRAEYKGGDTRYILALRADKANKPEITTVGFQSAILHRLTPRDNVRLIVGKASASPFMYDTYLRDSSTLVAGGATITRNAYARTDGKLLNLLSGEIGTRHALASNYILDLELFQNRGADFAQNGSTTTVAVDTTTTPPTTTIGARSDVKSLDGYSPLTRGGTAALDFISTDKIFNGKVFLSVQETKIGDAFYYYDVPSYTKIEKGRPTYIPGEYKALNPKQPKYDHQIPKVYGGAYFNMVSGDFNYNLTAYGMSKTTVSNRIADHSIPKFLTLNSQVTYKATDMSSLSLDIRNLTNHKTREFGISDKIPTQIIVGYDTKI